MNRKSIANGFVAAIGKGLGVTLAAGAAILAASEIPGIKRYVHILMLAKRQGSTRSSLVSDQDSATYAQAPRRSGHGGNHDVYAREANGEPAPVGVHVGSQSRHAGTPASPSRGLH